MWDKLPLVTLSLFCLVWLNEASAQEDDNQPPAKILPVTPEIESALTKAMQGCPATGRKIHAGVNKNGVYTLTGDLFHNGQTNALLNNNDNVIVCDWQKNQWQPIGVIGANTVWKYPNWNIDTADTREPKDSKPFWMLELNNRPLIVIAGDVEKAGQNYSIFLFNSSATKILDSDTSFSVEPDVKDDFLITGDSSRVKSEYGITYFSKIDNNKFVVKKSWSDFCPYHQPDPGAYECSISESDAGRFVVMQDYSKLAHPASWVVFKGPLEIHGWDDIANAGKEHKPYAKLHFSLKGKYDQNIDIMNAEMEIAYMFEKLTGLPRNLYRLDADNSYDGNIESRENIKVTGSPEAVKLLSP